MGVRGFFWFILAYVKMNLQAAMEYRASFVIRAAGMFVNDIAWVMFWLIIFAKFPSINGFTLNTVLMMYAILTTGFGFATFLMGNWSKLAKVIAMGQLDYYLTLPKPSLPHILVSRSDFSGLGDFAFGVALAVFALPHTLEAVLLFIVLTFLSMVILVSIGVISGSLSFFIGRSEDVQDAVISSIIALSTYPFSIFDSYVKIILLTAVPIGFITGIPVEILENFNPILLGYMSIATVAAVLIAVTVFKIGLKRYESGNLINVQI